MRMERPSRAAVIYERNGSLEKAAWHYSIAKQFEKSAECWKKLGKEDYRYFEKGIDNLRSCGQEHLMFSEMMALLMHENVVSTAFRHNKVDELIVYLRNVDIAKEVFPLFTAEQLIQMTAKISITPEMTIICANWVSEVQVLRVQESILNRFSNTQ